MKSTLKIWCSGIVILCVVCMCNAAAVSGTACTVTGVNNCSTIAHSSCNASTSFCQCNAGYIENKANDSTCIEVLGTSCTPSTVDCPSNSNTNCNGTICLCVQNFVNDSGICRNTTTNNPNAQQNPVAVSSTTCQQTGDCKVLHSECDLSAHKCKCSDGFVASTPSGESCVNAPVSSVACKQNTDCKVEHSECDTTASKCTCSDGFKQSTSGTCDKAPVSSVACKQNTDCKVEHSECDTTASQCTCSDGFKQSTSGTCDKESAAVTARLSTLSIGVSMTLFLFIYKSY